jgi:hypothetical protein
MKIVWVTVADGKIDSSIAWVLRIISKLLTEIVTGRKKIIWQTFLVMYNPT